MFRKILYPTDFSDVSKKALEFVKGLKEAGSEEVVVLHVVDTRHFAGADIGSAVDMAMLEEAMEEKAHTEIDAVADELTDYGFFVKARVEHGIPIREILRVEGEEDASLIVIGSHGKSNVKEMLLGSVSETVIRKAKKPVIVVKR
jgi:nucleotide-binding universal stress UspA family protein